jgi:signal transduction histidine kinase
MRPHRYLAITGCAVLLSWVSIIVLVYNITGQLRQQRGEYDELTRQLLNLEQMRASVVEIAAADDEYMMLGAINRIEHAMGRDQLARDHAAEVISAKQNFMRAFNQLQQLLQSPEREAAPAQGETPLAWHPFFDSIRGKYFGYLAAAERLNRLAGSSVYMSYVMKLLGERKSYQKALTSELSARIEEVKNRLGSHHPVFEATIREARDTLLKLMILAMAPALLTGYLALRGIMRMFGEISAHKEDVTRSNQSLETALAELRRVQEAMVQGERLSTLGKLTATVSHELRNPMSAIRNSLFLIREFAGDRDKVRTNVERAERSIARCDNILGDLLEYTRERRLNMKPSSLQGLTRDILSEQKLPPEIRLVTDLRGSDAEVMIDGDRFQRVVTNLIQNAAEAIRSGRGFGEIRVQTGLVGDQAFLEIADDGPGMSREILPRIFEPLFTTKSFGAGLGLPTAKQLVEQHQGKITVNSQEGVGSSFRVTLPIAPARQGRAA